MPMPLQQAKNIKTQASPMQTSEMVHFWDLDTITRNHENEQINEQKALILDYKSQYGALRTNH